MTSWEARKAYYKLHNNFYRALKHNILTPNEQKVMELELKRAKKAWDEAEEHDTRRV